MAEYEVGMVGIGVMGRNLLLNMADHGFSAAGFARHQDKVNVLLEEGKGKPINGTNDYQTLIGMLKKPRVIMMLVPAGKPVDDVIEQLLPMIEPGDLMIDAGNSYFKDTDRRYRTLLDKKINFFGMGVSGGEEGARFGPSIMPGGVEEAYERVRPVLEAVSAKVNGEPCVTYLGKGSAGHFVKMVHNGIEYGLMQLLAETYDLMKRGLGMSNDEMHQVYAEWNAGELSSFLVEITADIFLKVDDKTGNRLLDQVLDVARQKGTGKWTSQEAMDLGVPIPSIDIAVTMRYLSALEAERKHASEHLHGPSPSSGAPREAMLVKLRQAFHAAMIITYTQGLAMLRKASDTYEFGLNMEAVVRIWRGGCIIRSALLEQLRVAFNTAPNLENVLLDPTLAEVVSKSQEGLREVVRTAANWGIGVPGFSTTLGYYDSIRTVRLPVNLVQAQRDYFGAHTYERIDDEGIFHSEWAPANK